MPGSKEVFMSLLDLSGVSYQFGADPVFEDASFSIHPGDRIALIGANGSGKTTLLHLLTGAIEPARGSITRRRGLTFAISEQDSKIEGLSGGEHSREKLAQVLSADADLLVL